MWEEDKWILPYGFIVPLKGGYCAKIFNTIVFLGLGGTPSSHNYLENVYVKINTLVYYISIAFIVMHFFYDDMLTCC